jgi:hypothetical protein
MILNPLGRFREIEACLGSIYLINPFEFYGAVW